MRPGFSVDVSGKQWKCHPTLISYCCDIPEGKDMSGVKHGATTCPCICCLTTQEEILDLTLGINRKAHEMDMVFNTFKSNFNHSIGSSKHGKGRDAPTRLKQGEADLDNYSLNESGGVLYPLELTNRE